MKKCILFILIIVFLLGFVVYSRQNKKVYIYGDGFDPERVDNKIFRADTPSYPSPSYAEYISSNAPAEKTISIYGKNWKVCYLDSMHGHDRYISQDKNIECWYTASNGKLWQISIANCASTLPISSYIEEIQWINWIKNFVSQYYTEDWEKYIYSCATSLKDADGNAIGHNSFITSSDGNVSNYTFSFSLYVDGFKTSDCIRVTYRPNSDSTFTDNILIRFSEHNFDYRSNLKIDTKRIENEIDDFYKQYIINSEETSIKGYRIESPWLQSINNEIYYTCMFYLDFDDTEHGYHYTLIAEL